MQQQREGVDEGRGVDKGMGLQARTRRRHSSWHRAVCWGNLPASGCVDFSSLPSYRLQNQGRQAHPHALVPAHTFQSTSLLTQTLPALMRPTTPLLLLSLALLVSSVTITSATPSAFVVPPGPGRQRFHQPLLSRLSSRGVSLRLSSPPSVVVLSSSSPQKEGASKTGAEKLGPQGQSLNLTTANATAAAFDLLIDTIENWATVIGDRQDLCKGTCIFAEERLVRVTI